MSTRLEGNAREEWRRNWPLVLAACAGIAATTMLNYATGLFMESFQKEFGWTRVQITAGPAFISVACVLFAPFFGAAVDRFGSRRFGIFGLIGTCILTLGMGFVGPSIWSWWAIWIMLAPVALCVLPFVWTGAVSRRFSASRGLAIGVTLSGSGLSSIITPLLAEYLITHLGWRLAYPGLAVFWGVLVLPLLLIFLKDASQGRRAGGSEGGAPLPRPAWPSPEARRQLGSRRFLQLALAGFLLAAAVPPLVISAVPVLTANGLTRADAALVASLMGYSAIVGRLVVGHLLDRFDGRLLAGIVSVLPLFTCSLLLGMPTSLTAAAVAALLLGLALGAEYDILGYLASRYFALGNFGLVFGTLVGCVALAGAGGPLVLSAVYDQTHSYVPALWTVLPFGPIAAVLFVLLGPYPPVSRAD